MTDPMIEKLLHDEIAWNEQRALAFSLLSVRRKIHLEASRRLRAILSTPREEVKRTNHIDSYASEVLDKPDAAGEVRAILEACG